LHYFMKNTAVNCVQVVRIRPANSGKYFVIQSTREQPSS
jgi:hypothetical protein